MKIRIVVVIFGFILFAMAKPDYGIAAREREKDPFESFRAWLQKLEELSPDPCGPHSGKDHSDGGNAEFWLFERAADILEEKVNATLESNESAESRASDALEELEAMSSEINADWPDENRFHFQILSVPPVLVVKMTFRTDGRYFVFARPEEDIAGKTNQLWQQVGADEESLEHDFPTFSLELFALHRGPSGNARFLAKTEHTGCAGSIGVAYDAREWDPQGLGRLDKIIEQAGALGLDDAVPGFPQIGELRTEGPLVSLPYCSFSAIDTWDNPSLCVLDTYDLSGDEAKFQSRVYNRPELEPVAKVIEYAQKRDYSALLGYCASAEVAADLVRKIPPRLFAEEIRVTDVGSGRKRVELGEESPYWFEVQERQGGWVVAAFDEQ
jgi:hypothetical protein